MPLHLILIMMASIGFMLWLAFQDGGEAELRELQAEAEADARPDLLHVDDDVEARRLAA
jgi:hypothetical protein